MPGTKISSADTTGVDALDFLDTPQNKDRAYNDFHFTIPDADEEHLTHNPNWAKWKGIYDNNPDIHAIIDKKAEYVIGKGYKITGLKTKFQNWLYQIQRIRGCGIDTFNKVVKNCYKCAEICGDGFAEIVEDSAGRIINLKPMCPGSITIVANNKGIITGYLQTTLKKDGTKTIKPFFEDEIFHVCRNRLGSAIHGIGTIEIVEQIILMKNEAMADMKVVFHRYVKPLWIFSVDTDNTTEIANFKAKIDNATSKSENMILPKGTVDKVERVSIPQYSTLDPLPWIKLLQDYIIMTEGVPEVILGFGRDTTEASSKILYVGFQQTVENDQFSLEEDIRIQLGWTVEFEFPASLLDNLQSDQKKDGPVNSNKASDIKLKKNKP